MADLEETIFHIESEEESFGWAWNASALSLEDALSYIQKYGLNERRHRVVKTHTAYTTVYDSKPGAKNGV